MKQINEKLLDKKYFIFDIDGTLVDSMSMWNLVDQIAIFNLTGREVSEEEIKTFRDSVLYHISNISGDIYTLFYASVIEQYGLGVTVEEYQNLRHDNADMLSVNAVDFKPGAGEFLQILKKLGKKIGIATTTTKPQLELYSERNKNMPQKANLNKIADAIVACEDVTLKKPHPEAYLKVVEKLGAKPHECIVFEDSINGVIAAKEAGLEVCAVYDKTAAAEQDLINKVVDFKIDSFDELIKVLGLENLQARGKE